MIPLNQSPNVKANSLEAVNAYLTAIDRPIVESLDKFYGEVNVFATDDLGQTIEDFNAEIDKSLKTLSTIKDQ